MVSSGNAGSALIDDFRAKPGLVLQVAAPPDGNNHRSKTEQKAVPVSRGGHGIHRLFEANQEAALIVALLLSLWQGHDRNDLAEVAGCLSQFSLDFLWGRQISQ